MGRLALQLAFIVAGLNFMILKVGDMLHCEAAYAIAMVFCVPAVVLGSISWWMVPSFSRSWPVIACVAIAWAGLVYSDPTRSNQGIVGAVWLTMTLPIAALIVEHRCWWLCAKTYVVTSAVAMAMAVWVEYQMFGVTLLGSFQRFGKWVSDEGSRLANPNRVGGQLALAAVLALVLYLRSGKLARGKGVGTRGEGQQRCLAPRPSPLAPHFSIGWTVFLSLGCIMTASRAAFVAWLAGMALLLYSARVHDSRKLRDMVAVSSVLSAAVLFLVFAVDFRPWRSLASRLDNPEHVLSASGRLTIWKASYDVWCSDRRHFLIGTGNGAASEAIGRQLRMTKSDGFTLLGMNAHSSFVEWGLSHGLLGMVAAALLGATVIRRVQQQDRRAASTFRWAILLCFGLASMNYVTYRDPIILAAGALILSMVSRPAARIPVVGFARIQSNPATTRLVSQECSRMQGRLPSCESSYAEH
ncbi:MAG: O-antigen ligase family protein [Candidatus Nealsonbacteria bacterium]|nr:O-antigen ligase family protein [Candidatus Nealsonbacteria bacterium]